ncbi:MAG: hypothetical protein A2386_04695 [Elusimicrobia bacterium RIFOXYB1_FULL_48_9]|nr:MAG: hypothetical protein A2386_04695 [Elusimicrobia bacterium RIFOXYB1_FULL_48_9]
MVSAAHTLGVAHPPGYPFYTLISKLFILLVPFGSQAFRLNALSALAGAASCYVLYLIFRALLKNRAVAALLALTLASSYLQWYLALVSEMYTLNTLFAALTVYLLLRFSQDKTEFRYLYLASFLFGLGLGNRMDLLLSTPIFAAAAFVKRKSLSPKALIVSALLFLCGASVFFYLPVRSAAGPMLDWNHPADLGRFWGSLTRKTHGGTLDLISEAYAKGTNFSAGIAFYLEHLLKGFGYIGIFLGLLGIYRSVKTKDVFMSGLLLAWAASGPLFVFLSNMPPNPHALAILEAHFLLPNMLFAPFIGAGILSLSESRTNNKIIIALAAAMVILNGYSNLPELNKRNNFVGFDYAKNIIRSAPPGSVVVMKKDVQLFSLWNEQLVKNIRPDLTVISQGLSGSDWYRKPLMRARPGVYIGPLKSPEDWRLLYQANSGRGVFYSQDADYRPQGITEAPFGLLTRLNSGGNASADALLNHIYSYRGRYVYDDYREFFTPDLIADYSRAYLSLGQSYLTTARYELSRQCLDSALAFQPVFPIALNLKAFSFFQQSKYTEAEQTYLKAAVQYEKLIRLAKDYNALPDAVEGFKKELSELFVSLGVAQERAGKYAEGLESYGKAVEIFPSNVRAYFNTGVIYWKNGRWDKVIASFEKVLSYQPGHREAAYFLSQARARRGTMR